MITRNELRTLVEGELMKSEHKNKTRKHQCKIFGITLSQINAYLSHNYILDDAIQKMGSYFGETVQNNDIRTKPKSIRLSRPREDSESRRKRAEHGDPIAIMHKRAISEHQERIYEREEINYGL